MYLFYKNTYSNEDTLHYYIFKVPVSKLDFIHMQMSGIKKLTYVLENTIQPIPKGHQQSSTPLMPSFWTHKTKLTRGNQRTILILSPHWGGGGGGVKEDMLLA